MSDKQEQKDYGRTRKDNERVAAAINAAWGSRVAWVEERRYSFMCRFKKEQVDVTLPVVVSSLVGGRVPGRESPPFFAGPATGAMWK